MIPLLQWNSINKEWFATPLILYIMIGTLIGGVLGLAGIGANKRSTDSTNRQNLEIARMNNQWNEQMMLKQMQYNTDMWHMQNAYNDPSAQLQRLKDAGLNPYTMMNGGNSGTASSVGGVTPPTAQSVTMQPFQGYGAIGDMIYRGLEYDMQRQQAKEDLLTSRQTRQMQFMDMMNKTLTRIQDVKDRQAKTAYQNILNHFAWDMQNADYKQRQMDYQISERELEIKTAEASVQKLVAANMPQQIANELALQGAELALKASQNRLNYQMARTEWFKQGKISSEAAGIRLDNQMLKEIWDDLVLKAKHEGYLIQPTDFLNAIGGFVNGYFNYRGNRGKTVTKYQTNNIYNK